MIRTNNFASQCEANQTEQMPLGSISVFYAMTYFSQYRLKEPISPMIMTAKSLMR
jgi:hypothetical protein